MNEQDEKSRIIAEAEGWVVASLDEMRAAIREGNIQRISVANDRVEKASSSMKNELRRLAHFEQA